MINKPNPIFHMVLWGALSGQILGVLFIMGFVGFLGIVTIEEFNLINLLLIFINSLWMFVEPFSWRQAFQYGLIPGVVMGLVDGIILKILQQMETERWLVYVIIFSLTSGMSIFLVKAIFPPSLFNTMIIAAFIAACAATYAAHRHLIRLCQWNGDCDSIPISNTKPKYYEWSAPPLVEQSPDENLQSSYSDSVKQGQQEE